MTGKFSKKLGVPAHRITAIICGKRRISGDTALRRGHFFKTSPEFWMNLQKNYELWLAAQKIGEALEKIPRHHDKAKQSL